MKRLRESNIVGENILTLTVPVILALTGWLIVNYLTTKREINAKKRELVTKYQIEAFSSLNTFFTYLLIQRNPSSEVRDNFNKSVSMIQLLGSPSQITKFSSILEPMKQLESGSLKGSEVEGLLLDLRDELRKELGLHQVDKKIISMLSFNK